MYCVVDKIDIYTRIFVAVADVSVIVTCTT